MSQRYVPMPRIARLGSRAIRAHGRHGVSSIRAHGRHGVSVPAHGRHGVSVRVLPAVAGWTGLIAACALLVPGMAGAESARGAAIGDVAPSSAGLVAGSTWSIVAVDQATGDVGVAAATCLAKDVTALAALVPGKGAAAVQADFEAANRDVVMERLQSGERATDIVAALVDPVRDPLHGRRQYGVVTMHDDGVIAAGYSGDDISPWALRSDSTHHAVTVQGNYLTGPNVVQDALAAFVEPDQDSVTLGDRLMRALEAGSAAGGDRRCNESGVMQTCMSAFISVARAGQPAFAARDLGDTGSRYPEEPWLHLSVIEEPDGPNPIVELRRRYDAWRADNLPPCAACGDLAIAVPPGAAPATPEASALPAAPSPGAGEPAADERATAAAMPVEPAARPRDDGAAPWPAVAWLAVFGVGSAMFIGVLHRRRRA